ncbi:nitroreductase family protein [Breznakia pachnodae]|uniref:Nitroreductase n=1 Tax=Breznakia pachnodae TaxID=265178 RepID=A0ABU0E683_9FIRM|nr:nitroreductase family protein [Breznakia pachnodae]MDQ0362395.1 nitroreductase [Breznakia pachnodae]
MQNQVLEVIRKRRSVRKFKNHQISKEQLETILEAGLLAPYSEEDSLFFTVVQNKEKIDELNVLAKQAAIDLEVEGLSDLGQVEGFHSLFEAPTYILVSAKQESSSPGIDAGAAIQNMVLSAESMGLSSCWLFYPILAFIEEKNKHLKHEFNIPEEYVPLTSVVIGYKDEDVSPRKPNVNNVSYFK